MFVYKHADDCRPHAEAILKQKIDNYKTMPKCHDSLSMKSEKNQM